MTREELQAQQGKLLPDRIELRRAKRRRCRGAQEYTMRCDAWVHVWGGRLTRFRLLAGLASILSLRSVLGACAASAQVASCHGVKCTMATGWRAW